MVILVTGFEAFAKVRDNPSQRIIEYLAKADNPSVSAHVLPVDYRLADEHLLRLIEKTQPNAVLMLGVAQGRKHINLERIGVNINDASIPDNEGNLVQGRKIIHDAPVGYWSTLPLEKFYRAINSANIPVKYSNHAGAYLCNHVMYSALYYCAETKQNIPCGFIHVPSVEAVPLNAQIQAIELCIDVLTEHLKS